jgi:hypothetical protein
MRSVTNLLPCPGRAVGMRDSVSEWNSVNRCASEPLSSRPPGGRYCGTASRARFLYARARLTGERILPDRRCPWIGRVRKRCTQHAGSVCGSWAWGCRRAGDIQEKKRARADWQVGIAPHASHHAARHPLGQQQAASPLRRRFSRDVFGARDGAHARWPPQSRQVARAVSDLHPLGRRHAESYNDGFWHFLSIPGGRRSRPVIG